MSAILTEQDDKRKAYVTVTYGISGYFAVLMWWNPELDGFWEPWNTGFGRYKFRDDAVEEAKYWADAEELEYIE